MLVHHFGMLFLSCVPVGVFSQGHSVGSYYASFFFGVIEISTIFLTFVDVFHPKHKAWYNWLQQRKDTSLGKLLNAANEAANEMFRDDVGLGFLDIPKLIESAMEAHKDDLKLKDVSLDDILSCDEWARQHVMEQSKSMKKELML